MRPKRLTAIVLILAMVVTADACRRGDSDGLGAITDHTMPRRLTVKVTGARTMNISGTYDVRIVTRHGKGKGLDTSAASITFREFFALPDGWFAQPEAAVVGMYSGDGEYVLPAGRGTRPSTGPTVQDDPEAQGKLSVVQTTFDRKDKPGSALRFDYALQPCKVRLRDKARTGSASCPALAAHTGETISMEMSWENP